MHRAAIAVVEAGAARVLSVEAAVAAPPTASFTAAIWPHVRAISALLSARQQPRDLERPLRSADCRRVAQLHSLQQMLYPGPVELLGDVERSLVGFRLPPPVRLLAQKETDSSVVAVACRRHHWRRAVASRGVEVCVGGPERFAHGQRLQHTDVLVRGRIPGGRHAVQPFAVDIRALLNQLPDQRAVALPRRLSQRCGRAPSMVGELLLRRLRLLVARRALTEAKQRAHVAAPDRPVPLLQYLVHPRERTQGERESLSSAPCRIVSSLAVPLRYYLAALAPGHRAVASLLPACCDGVSVRWAAGGYRTE